MRERKIGKVFAYLIFVKSAVFIERDGILNLVRIENGHPVPPLRRSDFRLNLEAIQPIRQLRLAGFKLIVTTNQPWLSHGCLSRYELERMHEQLRQAFPIDDILVCPHEEMDECPCRKPLPGMFIEAAAMWHLDISRSFVLSDKWQDAEAARRIGCISVLVRSPWTGKGHHDFLAPNLAAAVGIIKQWQPSPQYA